jgi:hypothetical protein
LGERRQARRFERRRQPLSERRGGIAGERQDERGAGARRKRSEFLARRVVDERLEVDRRWAGQNRKRRGAARRSSSSIPRTARRDCCGPTNRPTRRRRGALSTSRRARWRRRWPN